MVRAKEEHYRVFKKINNNRLKTILSVNVPKKMENMNPNWAQTDRNERRNKQTYYYSSTCPYNNWPHVS